MPELNFCPHCGHDLMQYRPSEDTGTQDDPLYPKIVTFVIQSQAASASLLQRRFKIGYARAARLMDVLEENEIVSPPDGAKPRDVLFKNGFEYTYSLAVSLTVRSEYVSLDSLSASLTISKGETQDILDRMAKEQIISPRDNDGLHLVLRKEE